MFSRSWIAVLLVVSSWSSPAFADDVERADALFHEAQAARTEHRFAHAARLLEESLALAPRAPTAFNLGLVLSEIGRHRAAVEIFDRLLAGRFGELPAARRGLVTERRRQALASTAELAVALDASGDAELRIDGELEGTIHPGEPLEFRLDAGSHVLLASALEGDARVEERVELTAGEHRTASLRLVELGASTEEVTSQDFWTSSELWITVGVILGAAAAGFGSWLIYEATREPEGPDRFVDPVLGSEWTLRVEL